MKNAIRSGTADYLNHLKLFSKNARLFLLGAFFVGLSFAGYLLLLNLYLKELSFKEGAIGQVLSMHAWGAVVITLPVAYILQKFQIRKILIYSTLLATLFYVLLATVLKLEGLLLLSFLLGVSITSYRVAAAPFFMRNSTPQERTYLFSLNFGVMILAAIIGSLGGGYLVNLFNSILGDQVWAYRCSLYVAVFFGLLGVIPFYLIKPDRDFQRSEGNLTWQFKILKNRGRLLLKISIPFFIIGLGAGLIIPFLNLYFRNRFDLSAKSIGIYFALQQGFMLAGILLGPVLSKKFGMIKSIVFTQLFSIPFMLCLAFSHFLPLAVIAFLFRGSLMNMSQPIAVNFYMEKVSEKEQPLTNSVANLAWTSSWGISTNLGGKLIQSYGFTLPLLLGAALYVVSSILYFLFFSSQKDRELGKVKLFIPEAVSQKISVD